MMMLSLFMMFLLWWVMVIVVKNVGVVMMEVVKVLGIGNLKKKNLFDVVRLLFGWGIGYKVVKLYWKLYLYYKFYDVKL